MNKPPQLACLSHYALFSILAVFLTSVVHATEITHVGDPNTMFSGNVAYHLPFSDIQITSDLANFDGYTLNVSIESSDSLDVIIPGFVRNVGGTAPEAGFPVYFDYFFETIGVLTQDTGLAGVPVSVLLNSNATPDNLATFISEIYWNYSDSESAFSGERVFTITLTENENPVVNSQITVPVAPNPATALVMPVDIGEVVLPTSITSAENAVVLFEFEVDNTNSNGFVGFFDGDIHLEQIQFGVTGTLDPEALNFELRESERKYLPLTYRQFSSPDQEWNYNNGVLSVSERLLGPYRAEKKSYSLVAWYKEDMLHRVSEGDTIQVSLDADEDILTTPQPFNENYPSYFGAYNKFSASDPVSSSVISAKPEEYRLAFEQLPTLCVPGKGFVPSFEVRNIDSSGNLNTNFNGVVTLDSVFGEELTGDLSVTAQSGIAVFDNVDCQYSQDPWRHLIIEATASELIGKFRGLTFSNGDARIQPRLTFENTLYHVVGNSPVPQSVYFLNTMSDLDSPHFDGGELSISFLNAYADQDVISVVNIDTQWDSVQVEGSTVGSAVIVEGEQIGELAEEMGQPGGAIRISLNANANHISLAELIREVFYSNASYESPAYGNREIEFSLFDGTSEPVVRTFSFNVYENPADVEFSLNQTPTPAFIDTNTSSEGDFEYSEGVTLYDFSITGTSGSDINFIRFDELVFDVTGTLAPDNLVFMLFEDNERWPQPQRGRVEGQRLIFEQNSYYNSLPSETRYIVKAIFDRNSPQFPNIPDGQTIQLSIDPNSDINVTPSGNRVSNEFAATSRLAGEIFYSDNGVDDVPDISGRPGRIAYINQSFSFIPSASDPEGNDISFSVENLPKWLRFNDDTGELYGTPDADDIGNYENIIVSASDGLLSVSLPAFSIHVTKPNSPVETAFGHTYYTGMLEDSILNIPLPERDYNGERVSWKIAQSPQSGSVAINSAGYLSFQPASDFTGNVGFELEVSNSKSKDRVSVIVNVRNVNDAPVISGNPPATVSANSHYYFRPTVEDVDSGRFEFTGRNLPDWLHLNPSSGILSGVPGENDIGLHEEIVICVSDRRLNVSLPAFSIQVLRQNTVPVLENMRGETDEDVSITILLTGQDVDRDDLSYVISQIPDNGIVEINDDELSYAPAPDFFGSDSFSVKAFDGTHYSAAALIDITINSVNDSPEAVDDVVILQSNDQGKYLIDVLVNDKDADMDGNSDELRITSVVTSVGAATSADGMILLEVEPAFIGEVTVDYEIADLQGASASARAMLEVRSEPLASSTVINAPDDIIVNATGLLTEVDLGEATAFDATGESVEVKLVRDDSYFVPGTHFVHWQNVTSENEVVSVVQQVRVNPMVSIGAEYLVTEGKSSELDVVLNGESPSYPVSIAYTVSGASDEEDHDLRDGVLDIESGTSAKITFEIFDDELSDNGETVFVRLADSFNVTSNNFAEINITESALSPSLFLTAKQAGVLKSTVAKDAGVVDIEAVFATNEDADTLLFSWYLNGEVLSTDATSQIQIDPQTLATGLNKASLTVTRVSSAELRTSVDLPFMVVAEHPIITAQDLNNNQLVDNIEGNKDSDHDGIVDYLDAIDLCHVMPVHSDEKRKFMVQSRAGTCTKLGEYALMDGADDLKVSKEYLPNGFDDENYESVGTVINIDAYQLDKMGAATQIVIPLERPLPAGAWYRLYVQGMGWQDFVVDEVNQIHTAPGIKGICPDIESEIWLPGTIRESYCLRLTMNDGGPNDADALQNYAISHLGTLVL